MYDQNDLIRLQSVQKKIDTIYAIVTRHGGIINALEDIEGQPAILMLITAISEQFNKLYHKNSPVLSNFDTMDIKGLISVRNFIAHDYDGINLSIIEDDLRFNMPRIKQIVDKILS